mmetsp:Transcript_36049/g.43477  ORF Transcript_36049/g.43477 Transcript_36049/m.43477 type:complete len:559 (-) Transcript_36049:253-1929(-)|eukprot:CAMPEP_0197844918 /NCGR_PEP_ID=MMETSP1438-20131217/1893_1 /TAXON_ID=1461541 /ORGANISM="Pterosperma sp., Strain CCMP1384" /LENGTH=558 /DNA_ID=CAMNT_0043455959 /DNA_START=121 /DNA_END=1797 /DNA_ORIENTATION=+
MSAVKCGTAGATGRTSSSRLANRAEPLTAARSVSAPNSSAKHARSLNLDPRKGACDVFSHRKKAASLLQTSRRQPVSVSMSQGLPSVVSDEDDKEGDVYAAPERLGDGLRRHTVSVYVADERGMINRVSGVFARRGFNIESLAVGLWGPTQDRALFTIVVIAEDQAVQQLVKQIYKLPNVTKVEILTDLPRVERGLLLMKVKASPEERSAVMDLAKIFRCAIVDVSENSIMLSMAGDSGKGIAMQRAMSKYGILQIARTGKVALRRELPMELQAEAAGIPVREPVDFDGKEVCSEAYLAQWDEDQLAGGAERGIFNEDNPAAAAAAAESSTASSNTAPPVAPPAPVAPDGDVYSVSSNNRGVWDAAVLDNSCDPYNAGALPPGLEPFTLSIAMENQPGVLAGVTGVIARRGYNVQSLAVGPAERRGASRLTMVIPATIESINKLLKQTQKLVGIMGVEDITDVPFVERELMLIKVICDRTMRNEVLDIAKIFRAKVTDISAQTATIEVVGDLEKMAALQQMLGPYGILEVARTGRIALPRDSGVDNKLLNTVEMDHFF